MKQVQETDVVDDGPPWYTSTRYFIALIAFLGAFNASLQRTDLSMAIVCMVNHTGVDIILRGERKTNKMEPLNSGFWNKTVAVYNKTSNPEPDDSSCRKTIADNVKKEDGEFVWSKQTQGLVLGGVFWGYGGLQVICVVIIRRWGPKKVVAVGMICQSLLTILTPVTARWSPWALVVLRAIIGLFQGFVYSGVFALWEKWAPPKERSRLIALTMQGIATGIVVAFPMSALICKTAFAGGWPLMFYIYGCIGLCWSCVWMYSVYDDPAHHPRINPRERQYLKEVLGSLPQEKSVRTPWLKIFTSLPYLSSMFSHVTFLWAFLLLMSNLPIYMLEVLHFDIKSNGILSLLPFLAMCLVGIGMSMFADALIGRKLLSVGHTRKLMAIIGYFIPAVLLLGLSYLNCTHSQLAVALLTLANGLFGCSTSATMANFYDIAPRFAQQLMPIANSIAACTGILANYVVGQVTKDKTREQWQMVFFLTCGILTLGTLLFVIFGEGRVQSWALVPEPEEEMSALSQNLKTPNM